MKMFKNSNIVFSTAIILLGLAMGFVVWDSGRAQAAAEVAGPIAELGGCKNETECAAFCDKKENVVACVNYAEKQGLISATEAAQARKFAQVGSGPGGCKNQAECASYCDDVANIDACLSFASQNGLISAEELAEAKKVAEALKSGAKMPGSCKNKAECESYCESSDHMDECLDFAEKASLIPEAELAEAKKVAKALKSGQKQPGGCTNKKSCDAYCSAAEHMEECVNFALAADLIPAEEREQVQKILPLMKAGKMPGGCAKKEQCDAYCADEAHLDECANFAVEAGFMKPEELEMYKKTGGKGPGNCKSKETCEAYCNDSTHADECFNFAMDKGLIPEEQLQEIKVGQEKFQQGLQMATPEVLNCIKSRVGEANFTKIQSSGMPSRAAGEAMGSCFESLMKPPAGAGGGEGGSSGGLQGPPSIEDIQRIVPEGVEVTPEMMKNGPPSPEQIQNMIQERTQMEMEKRGAGSSSGQGWGAPEFGGPKDIPTDQSSGENRFSPPKNIPLGPPSGTQFGPPEGIPSGPMPGVPSESPQ